jgi:hypothetical protein
MFNIKYLLLTGLLFTISHNLVAQESQQNTKGAATTSAPQWSNRDMTYRGKNYDVLDSAYYPKFRRKQFTKYVNPKKCFHRNRATSGK